MKPTPENIKALLDEAAIEGELAESKGQWLTLPDDIPGYLREIKREAAGLPAEFADHERGLTRHAHMARHAYEHGDETQLRRHLWIIDFNLPRLKAFLKEYGRLEGAKSGGRASKRKEWAEELAEHLAGLTVSFPEAWATIPEDEHNPLELDEDTGFYRSNEGGTLVAVDLMSGSELGDMSRSNFEKRYFRPAKQNPDTN